MGAVALLVTIVVGSLVGIVATAAEAAPTSHPALWVDTRQVSFGSAEAGTPAGPEQVTVHNAGPGTATGLTIQFTGSGAFTRAGGSCAASLAAGADCTIEISYTPTGVDRQEAKVTVFADGGGAASVALSGRSALGPSPLRVTATSLDFGLVDVGTTGPVRQTTITNTTAAPVTASIVAADPTAPFTKSANTCPATPSALGAGESCTISWAVTPNAPGNAVGSSTIEATVEGEGTRTLPLDLTVAGGPVAPSPISINPRRLDFGTLAIGQASEPQQVTITNASTQAWTTPVGGVFSEPGTKDEVQRSTTCPTTLAAGASCTITYVVTPDRPGGQVLTNGFDLRVGTTTIGTVPLTLTVAGEGEGGDLHLNRGLIDLGPGTDGVPTDAIEVTVENQGNADLVGIAATGLSDGDLSDDCPASLAPGATCSISVTSTSAHLRDIEVVTVTASGLEDAFLVYQGPIWTVHEAFVRHLGLEFDGDARLDATDLQRIAALDAGTKSRSQVVNEIASSAGYLPQVVIALYYRVLGRAPKQADVDRWVGVLQSGQKTLAQVTAEFYASTELYQKVGNTDVAWVSYLYAGLLRRLPDAAGRQFWVNRIAEHGRAWVALRFFESPESRRDRVTNRYRSQLLRDPDPVGLAYWPPRLDRGDLVLAKQLASSSEYLRIAQLVQAGWL